MSRLIDLMGVVQELSEKLIKINSKDLEALYKPIKSLSELTLKCLKSRDQADIDKLSYLFRDVKENEGLVLKKFSSSILTSKKAVLSHKLNPIDIFIGVFDRNYYDTKSHRIVVGMNKEALEQIIKGPETIQKILSGPKGKHFQIEMQKHKIQSSMSHEITHWIDDTLHNFHITKLANKAGEIHHTTGDVEKAASLMRKGEKDVYLTDYEINAAIHSIKIYKKKHSKIWDKLTFEDLMALAPSENVSDSHLGKEWRVKIKKRMARERLLGKKMR